MLLRFGRAEGTQRRDETRRLQEVGLPLPVGPEQKLLPAAQRAFAPADWQALDQAFAAAPGTGADAGLANLLQTLLAQAGRPMLQQGAPD